MRERKVKVTLSISLSSKGHLQVSITYEALKLLVRLDSVNVKTIESFEVFKGSSYFLSAHNIKESFHKHLVFDRDLHVLKSGYSVEMLASDASLCVANEAMDGLDLFVPESRDWQGAP